MAETVFPSKDMAKLSYEFVAVIGHQNSDHGEGDFYYEGEKKHLCNLYDLPNCKVHEQMAVELQRRGLLKGVTGTPTHIIYDPHTLKELSRFHYMSTSQIKDAIEEAQKKLGRPVRWHDYMKLEATLDKVEKLIGDKDYRKALRELKDYDPGEMKNLKAKAESLQKKIMDAGKAMLEEAKKALEANDTKKVHDLVRDIRREFPRTDLADAAKDLLSKLKD
jgi:hypothetical protein